MPYPALPPELPSIVSVVAAETVHCSSLTDSTNGVDGRKAIGSSNVPLIPPEASAKLSPISSPLAAASTSRVVISCADLLGNTAAMGYLAPSQAPTRANSSIPAATTPNSALNNGTAGLTAPTRSSVQPDLKRSTQTASPAQETSPLPRSAQTAQQSYSISGISGVLSNTPQTPLMQSLNQAVMFDALVDSFAALSQLSAADLARLAKSNSTRISQAPELGYPGAPGGIQAPGTLFPSGGDRAPTPAVEPPNAAPGEQPSPPSPAPGGAAPIISPANVVEVIADRQDYDQLRQIFTAEGKVMMRVRGALLEADRVQVNLTNRLAVAEGNVALTRGNQVLRGQRFDYNFVQGVGAVQKARGDIFLPSSGADTAFSTEAGATDQTILARPLSDRVTSQQPLGSVNSPGGVNISAGAGRDITRIPGGLPQGGILRRLRFEAEQIDFTPEGWEAQKIDITNDPFSPPELVLRAERAVLTRLSPLQDEIVATRPRLVFDQKVSVPTFRRRILLDRREREPSLFRFGIDGQDRGGLFVEGVFNIIQSPTVNFSVFPQLFLQRLLIDSESEGVGDLDNYGLRAALDATLSPTTSFRGRVAFNSLDITKADSTLRASARIQQAIATPIGPHRLAFESSFRDRLFNGSLGFQTVQTSIGALFQSPDIILGNSGVVLNYQAGYQFINSDTDRQDLLSAARDNNRVNLGRFQTTASIGRSFALWQGTPLPATRNEGLNYTPNPVVPYINAGVNLRGVFSSYTSGDTQQDLIGTLSLYGQFGHFSRKFFDYTSFGIYYTQVVGSGNSPFLFDRSVDNRVLTLSFFQQLYGPLRVGIQTSLSLDVQSTISTDYFLEYSRRTHGIILRYNPVLEIGSISFRISDFNWTGTAEPFEGTGVNPVEGGLERRY